MAVRRRIGRRTAVVVQRAWQHHARAVRLAPIARMVAACAAASTSAGLRTASCVLVARVVVSEAPSRRGIAEAPDAITEAAAMAATEARTMW
jgi:hypothetical protein